VSGLVVLLSEQKRRFGSAEQVDLDENDIEFVVSQVGVSLPLFLPLLRGVM
jgi:NACalpha-BTF3-like transcription factor